MELPVSLQLRELGWALALGAGLGLLQDLLRPLRRGPVTAALADLLFCLVLLVSLLVFTLYAGRGRLRIFALAALFLSGSLWLGLISPHLLRLQRRLDRFVKQDEKNMKKVSKNVKK